MKKMFKQNKMLASKSQDCWKCYILMWEKNLWYFEMFAKGSQKCIILWTCFKRKTEKKTSYLSSSCSDIYMYLHEKLEELWDQDGNVTGYSLRAVYDFTHFPETFCWQVFPIWLVCPLISNFSASCLLSLPFLFSYGVILRFIK